MKKILILGVSGLMWFSSLAPVKANETIAEEKDNQSTEVIESEIESGFQETEVNEVRENIQDSKQVLTSSTTSLIDSQGVDELIAEKTTLAQAFPDVNFRKYVAETVLGKTGYNDMTDSETMLTQANIKTIENRSATINVSNRNINSLEGIRHFIKLEKLYCTFNKLVELDVSMLSNLQAIQCFNNQLTKLNVSNLSALKHLDCSNNQISELDTSNLLSLTLLNCSNNKLVKLNVSNLVALTSMSCANNQLVELDVSKMDNLLVLELGRNHINELNVSSVAKSKMTGLYYNNTNIEKLDLSGFTSLKTLVMTKSEKADLSSVTGLYITGSREVSDFYQVRLTGDQGAFSWDSATGYYAIAPNMNAKYGFNVPCEDLPRGYTYTKPEQFEGLAEGALVDQEGNLILGASLADVQPDGSIQFPNGGTIASPEGIYNFVGSFTINNNTITTEADFTFAKNTATYDPATEAATVNVGDIETTIEKGNGSKVIDTIGSEMTLPKGTVVTNNEGDKTYLGEEGKADSEGNVTSGGSMISVPADKASEVKVDKDGNSVLPGGSITHNPDGTSIENENSVIIDKDGNIIDPSKLIKDLLNEDRTDLLPGVNQKQIDEAQRVVDLLPNGDEKRSLQEDIDVAQLLLNNRNDAKAKVEDLLKPGVTQEKIDIAQEAVDLLPEGELKDALQTIIDVVQDTLNNVLDMDEANRLLDLISKLDYSQYTADSLVTLNKALDAMLSDETYRNQATLDAAVAKLQSAYDGLVLLDIEAPSKSKDKTNENQYIVKHASIETADKTALLTLSVTLVVSMGIISLIMLRKKQAK